MSSFESPKTQKEVSAVETEQEWKKMIDEAINFASEALDVDLFGEIMRDGLSKEELEKLDSFEKTLGKNVMDYIAGISFGSIGSNEKLLKEDEEYAQKEYARIRSLSREELLKEAEDNAAEAREGKEGWEEGMKKLAHPKYP